MIAEFRVMVKSGHIFFYHRDDQHHKESSGFLFTGDRGFDSDHVCGHQYPIWVWSEMVEEWHSSFAFSRKVFDTAIFY